jgi:putative endonuclease
MKEHRYFVYILANKRNGTLYIGVTNNLLRRVAQHKSKSSEGFTKQYQVNKLVWFDETNDINEFLQHWYLTENWLLN